MSIQRGEERREEKDRYICRVSMHLHTVNKAKRSICRLCAGCVLSDDTLAPCKDDIIEWDAGSSFSAQGGGGGQCWRDFSVGGMYISEVSGLLQLAVHEKSDLSTHDGYDCSLFT